MTSPAFPEPKAPIAPTPLDEVGARALRVASKKDEWIKVPIAERIAILRQCITGVLGVSEAWVKDGCQAKGIAEGDTLQGEEWVVGPWQTIRNARLLILALEQNGHPRPARLSTRPDGQQVARVFPMDLKDKAMFGGTVGEVWLEPGKPATQGAIYREPPAKGKVALVLGAGNVSSIAPMDVFYKLFVENEVVLLKMNPVNAWLGPHPRGGARAAHRRRAISPSSTAAPRWARTRPTTRRSTRSTSRARTARTTPSSGATRSGRARAPEGRGRAEERRPFTAELGCVTPVLVVPGPVVRRRHATSKRARSRGWSRRTRASTATRRKVLVVARRLAAAEDLPRARRRGAREDARRGRRTTRAPRIATTASSSTTRRRASRWVRPTPEDVVPGRSSPTCRPTEGRVRAHERGVLRRRSPKWRSTRRRPDEFLDEGASRFANDSCWGTLSCTILVHPATESDTTESFDSRDRRAPLRRHRRQLLGGAWSTGSSARRGAPSRGTRRRTSSPARASSTTRSSSTTRRSRSCARRSASCPTPVWFADHKNLATMAKKLVRMEADPSWGRLFGVAFEAFKG